jgi:ABC-type uncharacterized transport system permease subunit
MNVYTIIQTILISFVMILLIHYCYDTLHNNFVKKQTHDIGRFHNTKYQELLQELRDHGEKQSIQKENEFLPNQEYEHLQTSLFEFVQNAM